MFRVTNIIEKMFYDPAIDYVPNNQKSIMPSWAQKTFIRRMRFQNKNSSFMFLNRMFAITFSSKRENKDGNLELVDEWSLIWFPNFDQTIFISRRNVSICTRPCNNSHRNNFLICHRRTANFIAVENKANVSWNRRFPLFNELFSIIVIIVQDDSTPCLLFKSPYSSSSISSTRHKRIT